MMSLLTRAYGFAPLILCLATLGWAGNTVASRVAVDEVSPMLLIFLRWSLVCLLVSAVSGREMRRAWPVLRPRLGWAMLMGGLGLASFSALIYTAAYSTTAINLGIIQGTVPGMVLLGSFVLFGTRMRWLQGLGLLLTFLGIVAVVTQGELANLLFLQFNFGDLLMLVACSLYAGYTLGLRGRPEVDSLALMGYFAFAALLVSVPLLLLEWYLRGVVAPSPEGWLIIIYVALIPSYLSQVLFMRGVQLIGPGPAGLYVNTVPVFASVLAVLLLGEDFRLHHVAAMALVFAGIYLFERHRR